MLARHHHPANVHPAGRFLIVSSGGFTVTVMLLATPRRLAVLTIALVVTPLPLSRASEDLDARLKEIICRPDRYVAGAFSSSMRTTVNPSTNITPTNYSPPPP